MESAARSEPLGFGGPPKPSSSTQKFPVHARQTGAEQNAAREAGAPHSAFPPADAEPAATCSPTMQHPEAQVTDASQEPNCPQSPPGSTDRSRLRVRSRQPLSPPGPLF